MPAVTKRPLRSKRNATPILLLQIRRGWGACCWSCERRRSESKALEMSSKRNAKVGLSRPLEPVRIPASHRRTFPLENKLFYKTPWKISTIYFVYRFRVVDCRLNLSMIESALIRKHACSLIARSRVSLDKYLGYETESSIVACVGWPRLRMPPSNIDVMHVANKYMLRGSDLTF